MPGPNELENLLITKYGIDPDDAAAFADKIIAGGAGAHGGALKEEALVNVADLAQVQMHDQGQFARAAAASPESRASDPELAQIYQEYLANSANTTREEAARAGIEQDINGLGIAATELDRMSNMTRWAGGVQERPSGYSSKHGLPKDFSQPLPNQPTEVVTPKPPNPYEARLRRAETLRRQALGY